MAVLELNSRPWVEFDPTNQQHRLWFAQFQRTNSWAQCPVRFTVREEVNGPHAVMVRQLTEYYAGQEFADA